MMRSFTILAFVAAVAPCAASAQEAAPAAPAASQFKTLEERVSYLVGLEMGQRLKSPPFKIDLDIVMRGVRDAATGATPALSDEEMQATAREFQKKMMADEAAKAMAANPELKAAAEKNAGCNRSPAACSTRC
jgi:FKBP-type peptidyl-prolyl cis-trans isomerase